jgi:hypothetical protein
MMRTVPATISSAAGGHQGEDGCDPVGGTLAAGAAVTWIDATAPAAMARSAASARPAVTDTLPDAVSAMSIAPEMLPSDVPAGMGVVAVESQLSAVPPTTGAQFHPDPLGMTANVSPADRVRVRVGAVYAGPPLATSEPPRLRLYVLPAVAESGMLESDSPRTGSGVTAKSARAVEPSKVESPE